MRKMAKSILADEGIKVFQKDIKKVTIHPVTVINHTVGEGLTDRFAHREIILVEMKDGKRYEILRETVDKDGNFSSDSARFITREVKEA